MMTLAEKAHLLNQLLEEREAVALTLLTETALLSAENVHALKARHAALCRRLARFERDLEPHASKSGWTVRQFALLLDRGELRPS